MKTIQAIAKDLKVSPQAIYQKMERVGSPLQTLQRKKSNGRWLYSPEAEAVVMSAFNTLVTNEEAVATLEAELTTLKIENSRLEAELTTLTTNFHELERKREAEYSRFMEQLDKITDTLKAQAVLIQQQRQRVPWWQRLLGGKKE